MDDNLNWYVLRTKPRQEKKAAISLSNSGFEVYLPLKETIKIWSDRKKKVEEPIIPSYVFIHISEKNRQSIFPSIGITNYMFWLKKPVIIRDVDMLKMREWFDGYSKHEISSLEISIGSEVRVESGIMSGKEGIVEKIGNKYISLAIPQLGIKFKIDKPSTIIKKISL